MKLKSFIITFGSFILTTGLLYQVGYVFTIPWLMFHYEYINNDTGLFVTTGSLTPCIIGLVVSFIAEKIYLYRFNKNLAS